MPTCVVQTAFETGAPVLRRIRSALKTGVHDTREHTDLRVKKRLSFTPETPWESISSHFSPLKI